MKESTISFHEVFETLTAHVPFPWQKRLFCRLLKSDIPAVCDIPTGLGKTSVIPIWLLALVSNNNRLPRRLVYIVNRRTIVDQATELVESIRNKLRKAECEVGSSLYTLVVALRNMATMTKSDSEAIAISTLRGELADNKEWVFDPAKPAIIIGTVDMIGSKLLFSGYGDSRRVRPLHPSLLGCDTLVIHDEAHLTPAFGALLHSIQKEQRQLRKVETEHLPQMRVMELSATHRDSSSSILQLDDADFHHDIIQQRFEAKKSLQLHSVEKSDSDKKSESTICLEKIVELALSYRDKKARVVIYVQKPDDAAKIAGLLKKEIGDNSATFVSVLTGEIRGHERDKLLERTAFQPFLGKKAIDQTVYLVSTSAGEVGIDLHADHMVGDLTTLDSTIQRLGRVNRFGTNESSVDIVYSSEWSTKIEKERQKALDVANKKYLDEKKKKEKKLQTAKSDKSKAKAQVELDRLNLSQMENEAINELEDKSPYQAALWKTFQIIKSKQETEQAEIDVSPKALQDWATQNPTAFSPTPENMVLTDILLDLWSMTSLEDVPACPEPAPWLHGIQDDLPQTWIAWRNEIDFFDLYQQSPVDNKAVTRWFHRHPLSSRETLRMPTSRCIKWDQKWIEAHGDKTVVVLSSVGEAQRIILGELAKDYSGKLLNYATLVLPPDCGALSNDGFFDPKATNANLDIADQGLARFALKRMGTTFQYNSMENPSETIPPSSKETHYDWKSLRQTIRSMEQQLGMKAVTYIKLQEMEEWQDEDEAKECWLVLLKSPKDKTTKLTGSPTIAKHCQAAVDLASSMADHLRLPPPLKEALQLAARFHDAGKQDIRWQIAAGYNPTVEGFVPKAKPSAGGLNWQQLAGYRHELGSLIEAEKQAEIMEHEERDLILHMIATHHGWARPHFEEKAFPPETSTATQGRVARETMLRYSSLQERFGWWRLAWLESLLRRADGMASAEHEISLEEE